MPRSSSVMRGVNAFLVARYIVFGLFTICNAIICSVAVWNHSLVLNINIQPAQVDIYLIFLGAFSLFSIFTFIFVELLCVNASTTRVWFECAWVTLFWIMELAGGAALIAVKSCSGQTTSSALCTSQRVLLAFTWMCSIMLLVYLLTLLFLAASYYVKDPRIWVSDIRTLRATPIGQDPPSAPQSPSTARFKKRPRADRFNPRLALPQPVQTFSRPGLSSKYKIEPFPPVFAAPEQMDNPHPSDLPEAIPLPPTTIISSFSKPMPRLPKTERNVRSLSLNQPILPREFVSSIEYRNSGCPPESSSGPVPGQSVSLPTPSPLGDWPRQDVMQLPAKPKRKPPPSAFEFPGQMPSTDRSSPAEIVTQPRPRRPSGPRQRIPSGESGHRPPSLDLYGFRS